MRPTHSIESILGSRSRIAVLRALINASSPLNTTQIATRAGITRPAAASVLEDLADAGIVQSSTVGKAIVHVIQPKSFYVEQLIAPLFDAEERLPDDLESQLRSAFADTAESIVLFGSYARGEQEAQSDVDIAIVASTEQAKDVLDQRLHTYAREFRARYGATLSAVTYNEHEAQSLWRTAPAFFESLKRDAIVVSGRGPWEWPADE